VLKQGHWGSWWKLETLFLFKVAIGYNLQKKLILIYYWLFGQVRYKLASNKIIEYYLPRCERAALCPRSDIVGLPTRVAELHSLQRAEKWKCPQRSDYNTMFYMKQRRDNNSMCGSCGNAILILRKITKIYKLFCVRNS